MLKEKLDKYTKEIHYGLSVRQTKIQSSGNPLNQKQPGDGKKSTHTHCSSKPSLGIHSGKWQNEAGLDEPLSWIITVIFKWGDMELLLLPQIGRDTLPSTNRKEISHLPVWMFIPVKMRHINIVHFTFHVFPLWKSLLAILIYLPDWTSILKMYNISS